METYSTMLKDVKTIHDEHTELIRQHQSQFLCQCQNTEITRRVITGGAVQYVKQCLKCGKAVGNPISKATIPDVAHLRDFDATLLARWESARISGFEKIQTTLSEKIKQRQDAFWNRYDQYLESAAWKTKREKVLRRANYLCEACLERKAVQVHHKTYEHVGNEPLFELVAVCNNCHELLHAKNQ